VQNLSVICSGDSCHSHETEKKTKTDWLLVRTIDIMG